MKDLIIVFYITSGDPTGRINSWLEKEKIDFNASHKVLGFLSKGQIVKGETDTDIPLESIFLLISDTATNDTWAYEVIKKCAQGKRVYIAFTAGSRCRYDQKMKLRPILGEEYQSCEYSREEDEERVYSNTAALLETGKAEYLAKIRKAILKVETKF